jgi:hypothetical protein
MGVLLVEEQGQGQGEQAASRRNVMIAMNA